MKCDICNKQFDNSRALSGHKALHKPLKCECKKCGQIFNSRYDRQIHMEENCPAKDYISYCKICNIGFNTRGEFMKHNQCTHKLDQKYTCKICNKEFDSPSALAGHVTSHSYEQNKFTFKCNTCGRLFETEGKLNNHINNIHNKTYKCKYCNMIFNTSSSLGGHIATNHRESNMNNTIYTIECEYCDKTFTNIGAFKRHLLKHTNPNRLCEIGKNISKSTKISTKRNSYRYRKLLSNRMIGNNNPSKKDYVKKKISNSWKETWYNKPKEEREKHIQKFINNPRKGVIPLSEQPIIDLLIPDLLHTGLGDYFVEFKDKKLKNPDFWIKNSNKVIEVISSKEKVFKANNDIESYINNIINEYNRVGYNVLIIDENELQNISNLKLKILNFIKEN